MLSSEVGRVLVLEGFYQRTAVHSLGAEQELLHQKRAGRPLGLFSKSERLQLRWLHKCNVLLQNLMKNSHEKVPSTHRRAQVVLMCEL